MFLLVAKASFIIPETTLFNLCRRDEEDELTIELRTKGGLNHMIAQIAHLIAFLVLT